MKNLIPSHVAIVMDGNRRWAGKQGLPAIEGHKAGVDALIKTVEVAADLGIKFITVYALSTENLKRRSKNEISSLFEIMREGLTKHLPKLKREGVKIHFYGHMEELPQTTKIIIKTVTKELSEGKNLTLNVAINYGSRNEILRAAEKLSKQDIPFTEEAFDKELFTCGIPDPDMLIRTGGNRRLSNFLLWQLSYSELYFTDSLWPDFSKSEFETIVKNFGESKRNFGV